MLRMSFSFYFSLFLTLQLVTALPLRRQRDQSIWNPVINSYILPLILIYSTKIN